MRRCILWLPGILMAKKKKNINTYELAKLLITQGVPQISRKDLAKLHQEAAVPKTTVTDHTEAKTADPTPGASFQRKKEEYDPGFTAKPPPMCDKCKVALATQEMKLLSGNVVYRCGLPACQLHAEEPTDLVVTNLLMQKKDFVTVNASKSCKTKIVVGVGGGYAVTDFDVWNW